MWPLVSVPRSACFSPLVLWHWGLHSWPCICQAGALGLSSVPSPCGTAFCPALSTQLFPILLLPGLGRAGTSQGNGPREPASSVLGAELTPSTSSGVQTSPLAYKLRVQDTGPGTWAGPSLATMGQVCEGPTATPEVGTPLPVENCISCCSATAAQHLPTITQRISLELAAHRARSLGFLQGGGAQRAGPGFWGRVLASGPPSTLVSGTPYWPV